VMTHRELLDKIRPVLRKHEPKNTPWLLAEIDRWCDGDFDGEEDPEYPCCFCRRPASPTRMLLGCSANIGEGGKILGPKFHTVIPTGWLGSEMTSEPFPLMVCDDCVRAYESLLMEDTMTGRARPSVESVLADSTRALRAEGTPEGDALAAELERRFALSYPREVKRGSCTLCKRDEPRVVQGDSAQICGTCLEFARETLRSAFSKQK
jgi:hypothetical protein